MTHGIPDGPFDGQPWNLTCLLLFFINFNRHQRLARCLTHLRKEEEEVSAVEEAVDVEETARAVRAVDADVDVVPAVKARVTRTSGSLLPSWAAW